MGLGDNSVPGLEASGVLVEKHVEQMRRWREGQAVKTAGAGVAVPSAPSGTVYGLLAQGQ